jgi:hypothetical protein
MRAAKRTSRATATLTALVPPGPAENSAHHGFDVSHPAPEKRPRARGTEGGRHLPYRQHSSSHRAGRKCAPLSPLAYS